MARPLLRAVAGAPASGSWAIRFAAASLRRRADAAHSKNFEKVVLLRLQGDVDSRCALLRPGVVVVIFMEEVYYVSLLFLVFRAHHDRGFVVFVKAFVHQGCHLSPCN